MKSAPLPSPRLRNGECDVAIFGEVYRKCCNVVVRIIVMWSGICCYGDDAVDV